MSGCYPSSTKKNDIEILLERIEKLESSKISQELDPKVWVFVNERLDKLEGMNLKKITENTLILYRLSELEQLNQQCIEANPIKDIYERFNKLDCHINKLHDMVNLEDRITAFDVLNRITEIENWIHQYESDEIECGNDSKDHDKNIQIRLSDEKDINCVPSFKYLAKEFSFFNEKIKKLEENYLVSSAERIGHLGRALHTLSEENEKLRKIPHKCPICEGTTFCSEGMCCVPCDGTGVVWG